MTRDDLAAIGLGELEPGATERILFPSPTAGQALGRREILIATVGALLQTPSTDLHFLPAASVLLQEGGAHVAFLHENPRIVRISTSKGDDRIVVRHAAGGVLQAADDPGTLYWDTAQSATVVFELPSGFFEVESIRDAIEVQSLNRTLAVRPFEAVAAPIANWADLCRDQWMADSLRRYEAVSGIWHAAVAAGLLARLFESENGREAYESSVLVLRREGTELPAAPRRWARQLTSGQCETITDLGLAEIDGLHRTLGDLNERWIPDDGPWRTAWIDVCCRRDDLACAALVLGEAGARDPRLTDALTALDRIGRQVLFSVPRGAILDDERLRRVRLTDPLAWWGSPDSVEDLL
jgi:hypothetical protein